MLLLSVVVSLCCWPSDSIFFEVSWFIVGSFGLVYVDKWFVVRYAVNCSLSYVFTEGRQGGSARMSLGFSASLKLLLIHTCSYQTQITLRDIIHIVEILENEWHGFLCFRFTYRLTQTLTAWLSMVLLWFLGCRDSGQKYLLFWIALHKCNPITCQ